MLCRFDLHVHTHYSSDAADSPESLIAAARAKGLHGIAFTDHNTCDAIKYCRREGLIRDDGEPVDGFLIIPGVEVSTSDGHLLCIGTTLPQLLGKPAKLVEQMILDCGGIAIPAHPFDHWRAGMGEHVLDTLQTRVIETFNAAVSSKRFNTQAADYAASRGLTGTAASDAHHASAVGTCATAFELPTLNLPNLLKAIPKGGLREEHFLSPAEALKKHVGNLFRKAPPPVD